MPKIIKNRLKSFLLVTALLSTNVFYPNIIESDILNSSTIQSNNNNVLKVTFTYKDLLDKNIKNDKNIENENYLLEKILIKNIDQDEIENFFSIYALDKSKHNYNYFINDINRIFDPSIYTESSNQDLESLNKEITSNPTKYLFTFVFKLNTEDQN